MVQHHGNNREAAQSIQPLDLAQAGVALLLNDLALWRRSQRFRVLGLLL